MHLSNCDYCRKMTCRRCYNPSCRIPVCESCHQDWLCNTCLLLGVKGIKVKNRLTRGKKRKESTSIENPCIPPQPLQNRFPQSSKEHPAVPSSSRPGKDPTPSTTKKLMLSQKSQKLSVKENSSKNISSWQKVKLGLATGPNVARKCTFQNPQRNYFNVLHFENSTQ